MRPRSKKTVGREEEPRWGVHRPNARGREREEGKQPRVSAVLDAWLFLGVISSVHNYHRGVCVGSPWTAMKGEPAYRIPAQEGDPSHPRVGSAATAAQDKGACATGHWRGGGYPSGHPTPGARGLSELKQRGNLGKTSPPPEAAPLCTLTDLRGTPRGPPRGSGASPRPAARPLPNQDHGPSAPGNEGKSP